VVTQSRPIPPQIETADKNAQNSALSPTRSSEFPLPRVWALSAHPGAACSTETIAVGIAPSEWKEAEKAWESARNVLQEKEEALAQANEEFSIAKKDEKFKFKAYMQVRESDD
jgi:hypothetical protein